ncbi:MAG: MmcQ/YjbR family DNA-binding protein [Cyclobacteriaceae bacterium]
MDIEEFRDYCLAKQGVTESLPFDNNTLVFKVMSKMFALAKIEEFQSINLKCDPETANKLREQFDAVLPGYHMNKRHWNTVMVNQDADDLLLKQWIDDSYKLVVKGLPKNLKIELDNL